MVCLVTLLSMVGVAISGHAAPNLYSLEGRIFTTDSPSWLPTVRADIDEFLHMQIIDGATAQTLEAKALTLFDTDGTTPVNATCGVGLARDPLSGNLYGGVRIGTFPPGRDAAFARGIARIDYAGGRADLVGRTSTRMAALTYGADGTLYGIVGDGDANETPKIHPLAFPQTMYQP